MDRKSMNRRLKAYKKKQVDVGGDKVWQVVGEVARYKYKTVKRRVDNQNKREFTSELDEQSLAVMYRAGLMMDEMGYTHVEIGGKEYRIVGYEHDLIRRDRTVVNINRNRVRTEVEVV